ncbi:hypothetical protein JYQ62_23355 [Nostoc sp. UHCC 0702]|nr:hypothetical protein JYQ62_23355 [Nostoc sp. UHCC 0702]
MVIENWILLLVITSHPSPITHYPLPITHYPLPITHYPLPTPTGIISV